MNDNEQYIWLQVWLEVAKKESTLASNHATTFADACLKAFRERTVSVAPTQGDDEVK